MRSYNQSCDNHQTHTSTCQNCNNYPNYNSYQHCSTHETSSNITCKCALASSLQTLLQCHFKHFIDPNTFTLYTPTLTTPQDATTITNPCNCAGDLIKFESTLPYDALSFCKLSGFSVLIKNPLANLHEAKQVLSSYFPEKACNCECNTHVNSCNCIEGIKHYLTCQTNPINLLVDNTPFTALHLIGIYQSVACFIETGVSPTSPPVPYARILIVCLDNITALGTSKPA